MWTRSRQERAEVYNNAFRDTCGLLTPNTLPDQEHVYHIYAIKYEQSDQLVKKLSSSKIETQINYPVSLPFLPAYRRLNHQPEEFPNAWFNQSRVLSLPLYPELNMAQQERVISEVIKSCEVLGMDS